MAVERKGLSPIKDAIIRRSYWVEEGSDSSMKPGDGLHQRELKKGSFTCLEDCEDYFYFT